MWVRAALWLSCGSIAYVLVGYPAIAWAQARMRPRPVNQRDHEPSVSLIVPCHDEADVIAEKLGNIRSLDYPPDRLEVIVVDDGSADGTASVAQVAARDVHVIRLAARTGKAAAVNAGVGASSGEIVVLSDATALFEPDALRVLMRNFADPGVGAASGRIAHRPGGVSQGVAAYWRYEDRIRLWESASGSTVGVNGDLFAIRRRSIRPLPAGTVNDELTLALCAAADGERVLYEPAAVARDHASTSMAEEQQRRTRITAGRLQSVLGPARAVWQTPGTAFRLVSHKLLRPFLPLAGAGAIIGAAATIATRRGRSRIDTALSVAIWTSVVALVTAAGGAAVLERARRPVPGLLRVPQLLVSASAASVAGLVRAAMGTQPARWQKRSPIGDVLKGDGAQSDQRG